VSVAKITKIEGVRAGAPGLHHLDYSLRYCA
jgi:hypothetical protein